MPFKDPDGAWANNLKNKYGMTVEEYAALLCSCCNTAIGKMLDDPMRLVSAALYLRGAA